MGHGSRGAKWSDPIPVIGLFCMICALALILLCPRPTQPCWYVTLTSLATGAGCIATYLSGEITFASPKLKASGALAFIAAIFWFGKDAREVSKYQRAQAALHFESQAARPYTSDVYVVIDEDVIKADLASGHADLPIRHDSRGREVTIKRGVGGFRVDFTSLVENQVVFVVTSDRGHWWKSDDMTIPESELPMSEVPFAAIKNRLNVY